MTRMKIVLSIVTISMAVSSATAATTGSFVDAANTIPNTVANLLEADGQGLDWQVEVLRVDLTAGSVHNDALLDSRFDQSLVWGSRPQLEWDSFLGSPDLSLDFALVSGLAGNIGNWGTFGTSPPDLDNDGFYTVMDLQLIPDSWGSPAFPGPADIDGDGAVGINDLIAMLIFAPGPSEGLLLSDGVPQLVSAAWGNTATTDTGPLNIATITFSDNAQGSWSRISIFEGGLKLQTAGSVENGVMVPEPAAGILLVWGLVLSFGPWRKR